MIDDIFRNIVEDQSNPEAEHFRLRTIIKYSARCSCSGEIVPNRAQEVLFLMGVVSRDSIWHKAIRQSDGYRAIKH